MDLEELARFVLASETRMGIIEILGREELIPSEMSAKLNMHPPEVSRALRELEERELIKCLTSETKKGKIYTLTDRGYRVRRSFASFLERKFLREIMEALDEKKTTYGMNVMLEGKIGKYVPDIVIFTHEKHVLIVELVGFRILSRTLNVDPFFRGNLERLAFRSHDLKKIIEEIKIAVGFTMISKTKLKTSELLKKTEDIIEKFKNEEYFDYFFFNDEIDDFISYVEELIHS